jgi:Zn-dependent peptidase ImmA (M78 family)/transcriptional regulator with XRE-family HTH domain
MIAPERIKQIRLARGYSLDELADRMGGIVTKMALSQYENGKGQPRPVVLLQMARALGVKTSDLASLPTLTVEFVAFRRKSGMTKTMTDELQSRIGFDLEKRVCLQAKIEGKANGRFLFEPYPVSVIEEAEDAALRVRDNMGLGRDAIGNLTETLEAHGIHVFSLDTSEKQVKFDGISALVKNSEGDTVAAGIITRSGVCGERQRFTTGHETGHLFTRVAEGVDEEAVANRFAGALLVPSDTLRAEVGSKRKSIDLEELLTLKKRYGISLAALVMRMCQLDIITPSQKEQWFKYIKRRNWWYSEPEPLESEVSSWLRQNVRRAHAEGLVTTREAEEMLGERVGGELPALTRLKAMRNLSREERRAILERESEAVADLYRADLAKPVQERELTAFTALDGVDPVLED